MTRKTIWQEIELSLREDKKIIPSYPDHVCGQAGRVVEESGDLMAAANELKYNKSSHEIGQSVQSNKVRKAAIRTAAQAIRFLENFKGC